MFDAGDYATLAVDVNDILSLSLSPLFSLEGLCHRILKVWPNVIFLHRDRISNSSSSESKKRSSRSESEKSGVRLSTSAVIR